MRLAGLTQQRSQGVGRLALAAMVLLGLATVVTAWSAYEATRWRSVEADAFLAAGSRRAEAAQATVEYATRAQVDVQTWIAWLQQSAKGSQEGTTFFQERFRDEFEAAFAAWLATAPDEGLPPGTPFDLEEYALPADRTVQELTLAANALDEQAVVANKASNDYLLAAVVMVMVIFVAGVGTRAGNGAIRLSMILGAALLFLGGFGLMLSLPQNVGV